LEIETDPVVTLSRYFLWFVAMDEQFNKHLPEAVESKFFFDPAFTTSIMYLMNSRATLYVVIEGWKGLKLQNADVARLIDSPMVDILRRVRNGAYHFQPKYFDERLTDFTSLGRPVIEWVSALRGAFQAFFDTWYQTHDLEGRSVKPIPRLNL
jgi:hypothetical protein